jgi:hypothetical protein
MLFLCSVFTVNIVLVSNNVHSESVTLSFVYE